MFKEDQSKKEGPVESPEIKRVQDAVFKEIEDRVRERHSEKEYHAPQHSETVDNHSADIFSIIREYNPDAITEDTERARTTAARAHDMYIATSTDPKTGMFTRLRGLGPSHMPENVARIIEAEGRVRLGNEEASAVELLGVVTLNDPDQRVYTADINEMMIEDIRATLPEPTFGAFPEETYTKTASGEYRVVIPDPDTKQNVDITHLFPQKDGKPIGLKMDQFISSDSRLGAIAVAMGDLSQGGRVDFEHFIDEGNREFWESKPKIKALFARGIENLSNDERAELAREAIGWIKTQLGFILHQKMRFENILATNKALNDLPEAAKTQEALQALYNKWDRNILASAKRIENADAYQSLSAPEAFDDPGANQKLEVLLKDMEYGHTDRSSDD